MFEGNIDELNLAVLLNERKLVASKIKRIAGGTLGFTFSLEVDGHPKVLKTYGSKSGRDTIEKEIKILSYLYGDQIAIAKLELKQSQESRVCVLMTELTYPQVELLPSNIFAITADYSQKLRQIEEIENPEKLDNLALLLEKSADSLNRLFVKRLLTEPIYFEVRKQFSLLRAQIHRLPELLCHGDLSPQNIMSRTDCVPIVIDWEDAFWGIEGYDFLYWLTFFTNRKHYSQEIFGKTPWGKEIELALMVMILVLKSDLSDLIDPAMPKALSYEARIAEVLALK